MLQTAVTWAPKCFASCTAAVPIAPDAPYTTIRLPSSGDTACSCVSAARAPSGIAAASSKVVPEGMCVTRALSRMQMYSACAPNR